jgi:hypothetical protein
MNFEFLKIINISNLNKMDELKNLMIQTMESNGILG